MICIQYDQWEREIKMRFKCMTLGPATKFLARFQFLRLWVILHPGKEKREKGRRMGDVEDVTRSAQKAVDYEQCGRFDAAIYFYGVGGANLQV